MQRSYCFGCHSREEKFIRIFIRLFLAKKKKKYKKYIIFHHADGQTRDLILSFHNFSLLQQYHVIYYIMCGCMCVCVCVLGLSRSCETFTQTIKNVFLASFVLWKKKYTIRRKQNSVVHPLADVLLKITFDLNQVG